MTTLTKEQMKELEGRVNNARGNTATREFGIVDDLWAALQSCEAAREELHRTAVLVMPMVAGYVRNNWVGNNDKFLRELDKAIQSSGSADRGGGP